MAANKKTDNHNLNAKLDLRRHFLRKYHAGGAAVFDCCQGSGKLWSTLRHEFAGVTYWGVDVKPKKGRLKLDSVRVLQQPGWTEDVVDVDTYGSPWRHWSALLPNVTKSTTVFLTIGATMSVGSVDAYALAAMGLGFKRLPLPTSMRGKLSAFSLPYCLSVVRGHGLQIVEAIEAVSDGNARYVGVRISPKIEAESVKIDPVHD
jgi:hypothetical protein